MFRADDERDVMTNTHLIQYKLILTGNFKCFIWNTFWITDEPFGVPSG